MSIRSLLASTLVTISVSASAAPAELTGFFGHEFTRLRNERVWTVLVDGPSFKVLVHGDNTSHFASLWSERQRKAFWEKMWWRSRSYRAARCLAYDDAVLCFVPRLARAAIPDLKQYQSNYFHYDPVGGVMEVHRVQGTN